MSAYTPDSTVKFYQVDVDTLAGRTKAFNSAAAREKWFRSEGRTIATEVNCQVVKKRFQTIKTSIAYATIMNCNYMSFINPSYGNKIFYCHIESMDYLNNNTTLVSYTVDFWLTFMFDVAFDTCTVAREGLTRNEYTTLSVNPYADVYKMRTEEPLACSSETEPMRYKIAGNNAFCSVLDTGDGARVNDGWNVFQNKDAVLKDGYTGKYMWSGHTIDTSVADDAPFYVLSFASPSTTEAGLSIIYETVKAVREFAGNTKPYIVCAPEPITISGDDNFTIPYFGEGRHKYGAGLSHSSTPLKDTSVARPYWMVGCGDLQTLKKCIDYFNVYDCVSSILSLYTFPIYLLDEFIENAFNAPSQDISTNLNYLNIPYPNVIKDIRPLDQPAYGGTAEISPKLFRFPFAYACLEGVNGSGHIELQYEKMGPSDPVASTPAMYPAKLYGPRVDPNTGKPSYFTLRKMVSITADGIYIGVAPVDYGDRIDSAIHIGYDPTANYTYMVKSDLGKGAFYSEFPQVPYTTDAYYVWLNQQLHGMLENVTDQSRMAESLAYGQTKGNIVTNAFNSAVSTLAGLVNSASSGMKEDASAGGTVASMAVGGAQALGSGMSSGLRSQGLKNEMALVENKRALELGAKYWYETAGQIGNNAVENFAYARNSFVAPNYHEGSSAGALNFLKDAEPIGVYLVMRRRSEQFITLYNAFFRNYGYTANRIGNPAIAVLTSGDAELGTAPHPEGSTGPSTPAWDSVDQKWYTHEGGVFYTQTENLRTHGVPGEAAAFIEKMFNGGCLFDIDIYEESEV